MTTEVIELTKEVTMVTMSNGTLVFWTIAITVVFFAIGVVFGICIADKMDKEKIYDGN